MNRIWCAIQRNLCNQEIHKDQEQDFHMWQLPLKQGQHSLEQKQRKKIKTHTIFFFFVF